MAKKKITGKSKLADISPPGQTPDKLNLVQKQVRIKPTSFRLTPEDKQCLKAIAESVNELSPNKKISETMVIKALIHNGKKIKKEKLLEMIREVVL
jgi:hypothetical protein